MGFETMSAFPGNEKYGVPTARIDLDGSLQFSVRSVKAFELDKFPYAEILIDRELGILAIRPTGSQEEKVNKFTKQGQARGAQRSISTRRAINMLGKRDCIGRTYPVTKNKDGLLVIDLNAPMDITA